MAWFRWLLSAVLVLVGAPHVLEGQNAHVVDSLRQRLAASTGPDRFETLTWLGFEYRYSYPDSTLRYCREAFELGKKLQLQKNLSRPLSFIGLAYTSKGQFKEALDYHEQAVALATEQNDSVQWAHGLNNRGRMFFDYGNLSRAYDDFSRAEKIFAYIRDQSGLAYVYRSLANVFKSQGEYDKAVEMSEKAYTLRAALGNTRSMVSSLMEMALLYQTTGNHPKALVRLAQADSILNGQKDNVTRVELDIATAEILWSNHQVEEAFLKAKQVLQALDQISRANNSRIYVRARLLQGDYFQRKNDLAQASAIFEELITVARLAGMAQPEYEAAMRLAAIYNSRKNYSRANEYEQLASLLKSRLENKDLLLKIERLEFQLQMEAKDLENERLKTEREKAEALITKQRVQNILLWTLLASIGVMVVLQRYYAHRQRQSNRLLADQNRQLADLNREKDTLLGIVAHDFRSPLNQIRGLVHLIEMEGGLNEAQKGYIHHLRKSTQSAADLITDLLDVSSLEAKAQPVAKTELDPVVLIGERLKIWQPAAQAKEIDLHFDYTPIGSVPTDENYLGRVVDNLVSNAIKFSTPRKEVRVNILREGDELVLRVRDQGPGFSPADQARLFGKFTKLSARPTAGESSNGLGLAIVKTLVDRLGGTISLEATSSKGSLFTVRLPL
ncbi:MAG: ATP-binding protein [Cyclobacteriaceae bacterium]|nr:ATP-binding protein [Cyclobacteriaceae bacterium]